MFKKSAAPSAGGYTIAKSLRFRASASAYLNRTPASATNQTTWTWSCWIKKGTSSGYQNLFSAYSNVNNNSGVSFHTDSNSYSIDFYAYNSAYTGRLLSSQLMRDYSAWYHIVAVYDSTQATASNRMKLYLNGVQMTAFSVATYPSQNTTTNINSTNTHYIGNISGSNYFDGYMAEQYFIDGQALTPSSFGSTNSTTGVWQPIAYTGTYGTNGFYLPFTDVATTSGSNAGLGKDFSGNANYWNTNNISVTAGSTYDSMTDVPTLTDANTANYCVLNPLQKDSSVTVSNGNLTGVSATQNQSLVSTMFAPSNKFYAEFLCNSAGTEDCIGICTNKYQLSEGFYSANKIAAFRNGGYIITSTFGAATFPTWTTNDIVRVKLDLDNQKFAIAVNNGSFTEVTITSYNSHVAGEYWSFTIFNGSTAGVGAFNYSVNFGQRPFAYSIPSGFVALNTYNLPTSTIVAGNKYMDATLYTGTGAVQSIVNAAGFKPDFVWMKRRNGAGDNNLFDSVRGVYKDLYSNNTVAEATYTDSLTAFNSNGWSLGTDASGNFVNTNGQTMVGWNWQAGQGTTSSNTNGSITSTVSVNATAGFSVATFTSPSSGNFTIGHGLGVKPAMFIVKTRDTAGWNWGTWHQSLSSNTNSVLNLNTTATESTSFNMWGASGANSTTIGITTGNPVPASSSCVCYAWAEIAGFSKFGSYTGNGSTDGPFVYTGFRPKYVMVKRTDSTGDWIILDTSRDTYNLCTKLLYPNASTAEENYNITDLISNGFKQRNTFAALNASGGNYIYAAFAENPTKYALAR